MSKINKVLPKKPRGRPATGRDPVTALRLPDALTKSVEDWASKQADTPNRSEALRRLVELGLTVKGRARQSSSDQKVRAKEMAASMIDKLTDAGASADDKAVRKRRLLQGPSAFRDARVDRPKRK